MQSLYFSLSATLRRFAVLVVAVGVLASMPVEAQQTSTDQPQQQAARRKTDLVKFLAGAAVGLAAHEGGHLVLDFAFDARPRVKRVALGGIPFFAITHRDDLSPRRELAVSSAGFWVQESWNEALLTRRPDLRHEHAPFSTGALAFNILTSIGYGVVALAKAGPPERDTRGMADSAGVDERAIAAMVMLPAVLDGVRYFKPNASWAKWVSRAAKASSVLLIAKGHDEPTAGSVSK
jgi:hypothetical protein